MLYFIILAAILILFSLAYLVFSVKDIKKWQTLALVIASPLLVAVIYAKIGTPQALDLEKNLTANTNNTDEISELLSRSQLGPEQIQRAIDSLRARVEQNPNDFDSLNLLATTYLLTEQTQLAVLTLEKLISIGQTDADTLVKTADAYAFIEQGNINLRAKQLLEGAITKNPDHPQGLWLSGMAAVQDGDDEAARAHWERLLPLVAGTPQEAALKDILVELDERKEFLLSHGSVNINEQDIAAKPEITIDVTLADTLRSSNSDIDDSDTVFVFARAIDGLPAPLAVKRLTVADLPATVTLTEQDAMLPQATISQFKDIQISAKISQSGNPTVKEGDVVSKAIQLNTDELEEKYQLEIK